MKPFFYPVLFSSMVFLFFILPSSQALADDLENTTEIIPIDGVIGIEKTTIPMHVSPENKLPWGFVEGKIGNPVEGYPVIIQIFKDEQPFHFAQTDVGDDDKYEYKFRVRDIDADQKVTKLFEGDYKVLVFKVVYLETNLAV